MYRKGFMRKLTRRFIELDEVGKQYLVVGSIVIIAAWLAMVSA